MDSSTYGHPICSTTLGAEGEVCLVKESASKEGSFSSPPSLKEIQCVHYYPVTNSSMPTNAEVTHLTFAGLGRKISLRKLS